MSAPTLIVFDWGGVLLRICRSWEEGCERAGLSVHEEDLTPAKREQRHALAQAYQLGKLSCDAFFEELAATTHGRISPGDAQSLHDAWLIEEYPGITQLLSDLHQLNAVSTALLSNTNAGHWRRHLSAAAGVPPDFPAAGSLEHRFGSHLLGLAKPNDEIYHALESKTGVAPEQILFFDDLSENVQAAQRRGWRVECIDHAADPAAQMRARLVTEGVLPPG